MAFHRDVLRFASWDQRLGAGPTSTGYAEEQLFEYMCRWFGARVVYAEGTPVVHHPDAARITAARLIAEGARKGRSEAYLAHHWLGDSRRWMRLRAALRGLRARWAVRQVLSHGGLRGAFVAEVPVARDGRRPAATSVSCRSVAPAGQA